MKIFNQFINSISAIGKTAGFDAGFIFPYSSDKVEKRDQIWKNLKQGILLEDKNMLVPWLLPFGKLDIIKENRIDSGDRTNWYLGKRTILDGYEAHIEVMKWKFVPLNKPIKRISENLGRDEQGMKKFTFLKGHITGLLGDPTKSSVGKIGAFDTGEISWERGSVSISLVGIEHFDFRYTLNIGFIFTNSIY